MSSKPKTLAKLSKQKHKKEQSLETVDDYQAAGVDFEDAAGKWRAGDATKSMRFFHRALEVYEQGLQRFPKSFDLAYNRARVQLEIATHPILVKQLQQSVLVTLQTALESHRHALILDQDNPDLLFNTAQVLTALAEEIAKSDLEDDLNAVHYLEEALTFQDRCLSLQELKYKEQVEQQRMAEQQDKLAVDDMEDDSEPRSAPVGSISEQEEQWFSIVEPVTQNTLIDTAIAQLSTLTTLCAVLSGSPGIVSKTMLAGLEEYSSKVLTQKLPNLLRSQGERLSEVALVKANFVSALLEIGFRVGELDAASYRRGRDGAFAVPELELAKSSEALIANARSLMSFNTALAEPELHIGPEITVARWNALSAAFNNLVNASKIVGVVADDIVKTHMLRGDCSMMQRQMSLPPVRYDAAVSNGPQLLKNAEVFYRNASKLSQEETEKKVAALRSAIAQCLQQGDNSILLSTFSHKDSVWVTEQVEEMMVEGLLPADFAL